MVKCKLSECDVIIEKDVITNRRKTYCSKECQKKATDRIISEKILPCNICGKMVNQTKKGVKYCSSECRTIGAKLTAIETNKRLFGVEYVGQREDVKQKVVQTNLEKHGVSCVFSSKSIMEHAKNTLMVKYNVTHPMQSPNIRAKVKQTNECRRNGIHNTKVHYSEIAHEKLNDIAYLLELNSTMRIKEIAKMFGVAESTIRKVFYTNKVDIKHHRISNFEKEVREVLSTIPNSIYNSRKIIPPLELDIWFPDLNIAIECNGRYYHQDQEKEINKFNKCKDKGIDLYFIWDDEWYADKTKAMAQIYDILSPFIKK